MQNLAGEDHRADQQRNHSIDQSFVATVHPEANLPPGLAADVLPRR